METIANFGDEKLASDALARVKGQLPALLPEPRACAVPARVEPWLCP